MLTDVTSHNISQAPTNGADIMTRSEHSQQLNQKGNEDWSDNSLSQSEQFSRLLRAIRTAQGDAYNLQAPSSTASGNENDRN